MIDVCFFADEVSREDFEEAIKLGVEAGATTVEVRSGVWGKHVTEIDDDDVKRAQDVLSTYDVKVASIGSPFGKCPIDNPQEYERHLRHFDRMVELAHAFETQIIRGFAFWNPNRRLKESSRPDINDYLEQIAEKLAPVVPIAEGANVILAFENEDAYTRWQLRRKHVQLLMRLVIVLHLLHVGMLITVYTVANSLYRMDIHILRDLCGMYMSNRIVRKIWIQLEIQTYGMNSCYRHLLMTDLRVLRALNTGETRNRC